MISYRAFQTGWGALVVVFLLLLPMMVPEAMSEFPKCDLF
jgi:hypothetical protein